MSFVFLDAKTHDFIDIVEGRTKYILNSYFLRFKRKTKNKVKTICIDIYPPYMDIIKKHFPNVPYNNWYIPYHSKYKQRVK